MADENAVMEDVIRARRDMTLFMVRCGTLSTALAQESGRRSGSSAIGFAEMAKAFEQCSKVFRNYLRVVDKEIEDLTPGTIAGIESVADIAAVTVTAAYTFQPAFLEEEAQDGEDLSQADMRLLQEYERLEQLRSEGLSAEEEERRVELHNNFFELKV